MFVPKQILRFCKMESWGSVMKKIMFFEGDIETQGYFSRQIAEAMQELGHEVFLYDLSRP